MVIFYLVNNYDSELLVLDGRTTSSDTPEKNFKKLLFKSQFSAIMRGLMATEVKVCETCGT